MNPWLSLLIGVIVVVLITGATAFFVAQEFAYMAVDRARLSTAAAGGESAAVRALAITKRTSFMLSGAQLGITVTGLLVGYVAEPLIGVALAELLGGSSVGWAIGLGSIVALVFSTIVQMVLGELLPKNYAIARPDGSARWLSAPTQVYLTTMKPLIWFFDKAAELFLRSLRIEPVHDIEYAASATDLAHVVEASREGGELDEALSVMLDRILDFPRQSVAHAMVPRGRVDIFRESVTLAAATAAMRTGHSRYPILDQDDRVIGVVHLIDVLRAGSGDDAVTTVVRPALVLPDLMALPDALNRMRYHREQLACVIDEYGGFTGILTIEDLAEEIVGEIFDEHDPDVAPAVPFEGDGVWVMPGEVPLDEVHRALRVELPQGDFETIAGLAIHAHGDLPQEGQVIEVELPIDPDALLADDAPGPTWLRIEVLEVSRYVPSLVRLTVADGFDERDLDHATGSGGEPR
jgi:CBS domain containing-hemolysin-like protein